MSRFGSQRKTREELGRMPQREQKGGPQGWKGVGEERGYEMKLEMWAEVKILEKPSV